VTWPAIKSDRDFPDTVDGLKILLPRWFPELETQDDGTPEGIFHVGRAFPDDMQAQLPYVRCRDIGGNDDGLTDVPLIDIDVFHSSFRAAKNLAKDIRAKLLGYPHRVEGLLIIDRVKTAMRPHDVPWEDDRVFRQYSSYQISARR
jgi:hypothetical protein